MMSPPGREVLTWSLTSFPLSDTDLQFDLYTKNWIFTADVLKLIFIKCFLRAITWSGKTGGGGVDDGEEVEQEEEVKVDKVE